MKSINRWIFLTCVLFLATGTFAQDKRPERPSVHLTGLVLDEQGQPVPNASMGFAWTNIEPSDGKYTQGKFRPHDGITTDKAGKFEGTLSWHQFPVVMMVMSADRTLAAVVKISEDSGNEPLKIVLKQASHLKISPKVRDLPNEDIIVMIGHRQPQRSPFGSFIVKGDLTIPMPPGHYGFLMFSDNSESLNKELMIGPGENVNWDDLVIEQNILSQRAGKEPPEWHVTDARGIDENLQLDDLKGKWVILEFWGYW